MATLSVPFKLILTQLAFLRDHIVQKWTCLPNLVAMGLVETEVPPFISKVETEILLEFSRKLWKK